MSSGAECGFTENEQGEWRYWLQDWPYGDTYEGQTFGPFTTLKQAQQHLQDNHQNPGGYGIEAVTLKGKEEAYGWPGGIKPEWPDYSASRTAECGKCGAPAGTKVEGCVQCNVRSEYLTKRELEILREVIDYYGDHEVQYDKEGDTSYTEVLIKAERLATRRR